MPRVGTNVLNHYYSVWWTPLGRNSNLKNIVSKRVPVRDLNSHIDNHELHLAQKDMIVDNGVGL